LGLSGRKEESQDLILISALKESKVLIAPQQMGRDRSWYSQNKLQISSDHFWTGGALSLKWSDFLVKLLAVKAHPL